FGIRTPDQAAAVARIADAAVVGSALVDEIESAAKVNENVTEKVLLKASELAKAVRSARLEMA
ncbi:MAG TPA: tryptophan synthase subunit alpha, partial [Caulobacter sp.]|nr:tryptophan synthase subunit alpha [Caulobacter sp.]